MRCRKDDWTVPIRPVPAFHYDLRALLDTEPPLNPRS
jgi:hypothetical protein